MSVKQQQDNLWIWHAVTYPTASVSCPQNVERLPIQGWADPKHGAVKARAVPNYTN